MWKSSSHVWHMVLVAGIVVGAVWLGAAWSSALLFAALTCAAMLGAVVWFVLRSVREGASEFASRGVRRNHHARPGETSNKR
jgi:hypothetical protein